MWTVNVAIQCRSNSLTPVITLSIVDTCDNRVCFCTFCSYIICAYRTVSNKDILKFLKTSPLLSSTNRGSGMIKCEVWQTLFLFFFRGGSYWKDLLQLPRKQILIANTNTSRRHTVQELYCHTRALPSKLIILSS